ncbi:tyrosine-type recombinase/integrase [Pedobacter ureilyticus]|uniref:Tyrosine-type recombinase/integrase n=1 Tax=Pedobacter ureilyticus TaxID=1393051 RepID=A0ABW9J2Z1_9SPHI|nr:site-specific integrase [Pedobacter helvus]
MRPPSKPELNTNNDKTWYITWNHDVPFPLWKYYPRRRIRIKVYDNINRYSGVDREKYAAARLRIWQYAVGNGLYNPFEAELAKLTGLTTEIAYVETQIEEVKEEINDKNRQNHHIKRALGAFMESRRQRKLNPKSIVSYQNSVDWITQGLIGTNNFDVPVGKLKHIHLSAALNFAADERKWSATTINKQVGFLMAILNWLEIEDYIVKNPSKNKFMSLPVETKKHKWYDRELAAKVKEEVLLQKKLSLYRAMQFVYWLCIRSKDEIRKLKIADIDTDLQRIRFSSELSKNRKEQYRPYPEEFSLIIKEMKLEKYPKNYFVFGGGDGSPGPTRCGHNFFSKQFKAVKDKLYLSDDYTIYGWKHTRMVHELMKGTALTDISYLARHSDFKTTEIYLRDFDINLKKVYEPKDLTF